MAAQSPSVGHRARTSVHLTHFPLAGTGGEGRGGGGGGLGSSLKMKKRKEKHKQCLPWTDGGGCEGKKAKRLYRRQKHFLKQLLNVVIIFIVCKCFHHNATLQKSAGFLLIYLF